MTLKKRELPDFVLRIYLLLAPSLRFLFSPYFYIFLISRSSCILPLSSLDLLTGNLLHPGSLWCSYLVNFLKLLRSEILTRCSQMFQADSWLQPICCLNKLRIHCSRYSAPCLKTTQTTKPASDGHVHLSYLKSWVLGSVRHWGCCAKSFSFLAGIQCDPSVQSVHDRTSCWVMTLRCWCSHLSIKASSIDCCLARINWLWHQDLFITLVHFCTLYSYWICEVAANLPCFCSVLLFSIIMWYTILILTNFQPWLFLLLIHFNLRVWPLLYM